MTLQEALNKGRWSKKIGIEVADAYKDGRLEIQDVCLNTIAILLTEIEKLTAEIEKLSSKG